MKMIRLRFNLIQKFAALHITTHLLALFGIIWVVQTKNYNWLLVSFVVYLFAGIVGVNIALHRYFAHHSFKTHAVGYWFLLIASFFPMLGSPAMWGSVHRFHHMHSDKDLDPHNPRSVGVLRSWFTIWPRIDIPMSLFRPFVKDKNIAFLDRNYFKLIMLYGLALAFIDIKFLVFIFAIPAVGCFHGAASIAVLPHLDGWGSYANHKVEDYSRNNFFAWILSLGEGWHNNHHHNPAKYRHGEKWWEVDPPAFIIKNFFMTGPDKS
jgi:fatty-acid desaturase